MSRRRGFLLCAFPALSPALWASDEKTRAAPASNEVTETAGERGVPALFSWADYDGDGRLDLAAVSGRGELQLLASLDDGRFEDVTGQVGIQDVANVALALWADYDGDGRLDLFVGAHEGESRLFHNEGGVFVDMSDGSGLAVEGAVQSAHWLDHDGDGRLDLHVVTAERNELFRGLEGGFFGVAELPLPGATVSPLPGRWLGSGEINAPAAEGDSGGRALRGRQMNSGSPPTLHLTPARATSGPSDVAALVPSPACISSIEDQANPGSCLMASTTPALGRLYPLSANLFVAVGGNVGIGTTSPSAKLHVAGTARVTDTLTLAPGGDQALDVSSGSIYKGGALFIHSKGSGLSPENTAIGREALANVTYGVRNTAIGHRALTSTTYGNANTACGNFALRSNTTGSNNTAIGNWALFYNTTGDGNTACGTSALRFTTSNNNTACGASALSRNTTGLGASAAWWASPGPRPRLPRPGSNGRPSRASAAASTGSGSSRVRARWSAACP